MRSDAKKVLYIDLRKRASEIKVHSDLSDSLGGVGLGAILLYDLLKEDPVIFSVGPFSSILPCCSQTAAVFVSPLSKDWGESYCGGWTAAAIRFSALDAIVITGRSKRPVYLVIEDGGVEFKDASSLWGKGNFETYRILSENEGLPGMRSILTIGPAGENQIAFASVSVDQFFCFQRLGLGGLLGSKGVKAIVISGTQSEEIENLRLFNQIYQDILAQVITKERFSQTSSGLEELFQQNKIGGLITKNLSETRFDLLTLRPEKAFLGKFNVKKVASFSCPIASLDLAEFNGSLIPYDFESLASLGPLLGIETLEGVLAQLAVSLDYGLDPVSLGVALAYLTELKKLDFSDYQSYLPLIETLIQRKEPWARVLSQGVREASSHLGGEDFALQIAGVEIAPYFNGYATVLGQILGVSHTFHDNDGHKIDLNLLGEEFEDADLVEALINSEKKLLVLNSLVVDFFVRDLYSDLSLIFSALNPLGFSWSRERLEKFSEEVYHLKLRVKKVLGFNLETVDLPQRLFSVPSAYGLLKRERIKSMIDLYNEKVFKKCAM